MNSPQALPFFFGAASLIVAGVCLILLQRWRRRSSALQAEVRRLSEDLLQAVELQSDMYGRVCRSLKDVEERVLELSVPSAEAPPPLERRHQVLTLARRGISPDEIASRLNMPKGEAELILNLRKFVDAGNDSSKTSLARTYARPGASAS